MDHQGHHQAPRRRFGRAAVLAAMGVLATTLAFTGGPTSAAEPGMAEPDAAQPDPRYRELTVQLSADGRTAASVSPPPAGSIEAEVVDRQVRSGVLPVERAVELTSGRLLVVGRSSDGSARWSSTMADPTVIRAEHPDAAGALHGTMVHLPQAELVVRVPADQDLTRVDVYRPNADGTPGEERVASIPAGAVPAPAEADTPTTSAALAPGENRIDIAIVGDGYTTAELPDFATDVDGVVEDMFDQAPFDTYEPYFAIHRVDVASAQSGADHPDRSPQVFVDTAFDATYNCANIVRLICVDNTDVINALSAELEPSEMDVILVLVNDPEYGGSGGQVAVASIDPYVVELVLHELGHSFGLLADEYFEGGNNPTCASTEPAEVNATKATTRAAVKWNHWIAAATPVPTTSTTPGVPGLYEGSKYCPTGLYRPTHDSKMRNLGKPFEQINSEQLVRRAYSYVSPIDTTSPAPDQVPYVRGGSQLFSVTPLDPNGHDLATTWKVDGIPVGLASTYTLRFGDLGPGTHTVSVEVQDPTTLVRVDPSGLLADVRSWTVTGVPAVKPIGDLDGNERTDIAIYRPGTGRWWTSSPASTIAFGAAGDIPVVGNYDGNGTADRAVFRPSSGRWYVDGMAGSVAFGARGDIPVPGQYDADPATDRAVFRPASGRWYIEGLANPVAYGTKGDLPVPADYDGDGTTDLAVYRPSNGRWYVDGIAGFTTFGIAGDIPVPGQYDADAAIDFAVFRPSSGRWYVDGSPGFVTLGTNGDIPVPGQYDADAATDFAVYRPADGRWFVGDTSGSTPFGAKGDVPAPISAAVYLRVFGSS